MVCLTALAVIWLLYATSESFSPGFELRPFVAGAMLSAMIALLAIACVTRSLTLRIIGAVAGVLLALRQYLMLAMADVGLGELIREPHGWIGPVLLTLFLFASAVAVVGRDRNG